MPGHTGHLGIGDRFDRIGRTGVFRDVARLEIDGPRGLIVDHVLEHRAKADRIVDLRFLLRREMDALRVTASLDVEDPVIAPAMFVVADQPAGRVGRERGLPRAREPEEERHIIAAARSCRPLVGRAVHGEHTPPR